MIFYKKQIINPESFRNPSFFISPFGTSDLEKNNIIVQQNLFNETIYEKYNDFFGENHEYFLSGKEAINKVLHHYNLDREDEVLILTTTSNLYVSSCVTQEVEKFCKWSRVKTDKTKLIFIIHEFGKVFQDIEKIKTFNLPIIEDCAMSMLSNDDDNKVGRNGDFTIYSIPKFFPVQFGGILRINSKNYTPGKAQPYQDYLKRIMLHYFGNVENIVQKRRENNKYLIAELEKLGFKSYFDYTDYEAPSVCMFENNGYDLAKLKVFLQTNGVECSIFYGKDVFFIPVHQNLNTFEMDFIVNLIEFFIYENK